MSVIRKEEGHRKVRATKWSWDVWKSLILLVPPAGIGPAAHGLGIHCSIH
jgi:hypothetical protein